jgi:CheY-like chemotaxis protein
MLEHGGKLLLLLASRDPQTAAELARGSHQTSAETRRQLLRLIEHGFAVASTGDDQAVYQLTPKGTQVDQLDPQQRILVVDDDALLQELVTVILEDDGYVVMAISTSVDATTILGEVAFDLVMTDSFGRAGGAALVNAAELLAVAAPAPVVLFTAHHLELDDVLAAGFRGLLEKPFEIATLERQVRALLQRARGGAQVVGGIDAGELTNQVEIEFVLLAQQAEVRGNGGLWVEDGGLDTFVVRDLAGECALAIVVGVLIPATLRGVVQTVRIHLEDEHGQRIEPSYRQAVWKYGEGRPVPGAMLRAVTVIRPRWVFPKTGTYVTVISVDGGSAERRLEFSIKLLAEQPTTS